MGSLPQIEAGRYKLEAAGDIRLLREHKGDARGRSEGSFRRKFPQILMLDIEAKGPSPALQYFCVLEMALSSGDLFGFQNKTLDIVTKMKYNYNIRYQISETTCSLSRTEGGWGPNFGSRD